MKLNAPAKNLETTHEGATAAKINSLQRLRRSVLACLLWENGFYEDGEEISNRIIETAKQVKPTDLAALAIEARRNFNLRHVPLLLASVLCSTGKGSSLVSETIYDVIQRADELSEILAIYAKVNGCPMDHIRPISAQMKKGLAKAFTKFDEYQLAKYNRDSAIKLKDVLFLCCAKPTSEEQAKLWKRLVSDELAVPDTWEVQLSSGKDKKEVFERLLSENKLGYLALLRNLRNMSEASVDEKLVKQAILARKGAQRVLPFRYIAAAKAVPRWEEYIDLALFDAISEIPAFEEPTIVLVDVSGSMVNAPVSAKSDMTRLDAAAALASIIRGNLRIFTFSDKVLEVPPRRGLAGVDAVKTSQSHLNTHLASALIEINKIAHERLIVITDEQAHREWNYFSGKPVKMPDPVCKHPYMINVGVSKNGIGYGKWTHIDGFSEQVIRYIQEIEKES